MFQKNAITTLFIMLLASQSLLAAESANGIPVRLQLDDAEEQTCLLLDSNSDEFLIFDPVHGEQLIVPRDRVNYLDLNLQVDLTALARSEGPDLAQDRLHLTSGQVIPCVVLEITDRRLTYAIPGKFSRNVIDPADVTTAIIGAARLPVSFSSPPDVVQVD